MRPSRVDDLFVDQDEPYPDIRQQPGSAPGQLDEAGNASGPRQPHLGQVVERGDTHVLVDMLSQRRGRTTGRRGGGALCTVGSPASAAAVLAAETRLSPHTPAARTIIPALLVGPTPRRHSPLAAAQSAANRAPCVPGNITTMIRKHNNAPRVALVRLRRALGACKAARAQQGAGPPRE